MQLLFGTTLFLSAALLFLVQLMVAKMILPLLGGTPAVWITCMIFFQTFLLAGYLYSHVTTRVGTRRQLLMHLGVLLLPLLTLPWLGLPLRIAAGDGGGVVAAWLGSPPTETNPLPWLLGLLLLCVGVPFFVVATTAPLLQKWFAATRVAGANDPYFLYGASNLGSMLALLSYPAAVEPGLRLAAQGYLWTGGYILLIGLAASCAWATWRTMSLPEGIRAGNPSPAANTPADRLPLRRRCRWVALAFVPSSLLFGVTTYLSTDIAALPLLWVVPLVLYLLTFILVFARKVLIPHRGMVLLLPVMLLVQLYLILTGSTQSIGTLIGLHLLTFFVAAMVCHGELAGDRPDPAHLTEYYLWMSLGGVLGGLFDALAAPLLFSTVTEYPLELMLACLLGPRLSSIWQKPALPGLTWGLPLVLGAAAAVLLVFVQSSGLAPAWFRALIAFGLAVLLYLAACAYTDRPLLFGLSVGGLILISISDADSQGRVLYRVRTFFGILRVTIDPETDTIQLMHGNTVHGRQSRDPRLRGEPLTYYHRKGPIGQVFDLYERTRSGQPVGLIGLGTGSLACYGQPGQELTYYEIDPAIERIARTPAYFTFLEDAEKRGVRLQVILGDARLRLRTAPDLHHGLIVVDAFSSDAIPVHLLTRQAIQDVYLRKLRPDGLLAFHTSNRYVDLQPILGDLAADANLVCRVRSDPGNERIGKAPSTWVLLARDEAHLGPLARDPNWRTLTARPGVAVWTDDYSNILGVINWSPRQGPGAQQAKNP